MSHVSCARRATRAAVPALLAVLFLLNCAIPLMSRYQPMKAGQCMDPADTIIVVRYQSERLTTIQRGSMGKMAGCVVPAVIVGCLAGAAAGGGIGYALAPDNLAALFIGLIVGELAVGLGSGFGTRAIVTPTERVNADSVGLPDIGKLALARFVQRAVGELPDWPAMSVDSTPVIPFYARKPGYTLEFAAAQSCMFQYRSVVCATLFDSRENIIWQRAFDYRSPQGVFHEPHGVEADKYQWLREDIEDAADSTAGDLIAHLKK